MDRLGLEGSLEFLMPTPRQGPAPLQREQTEPGAQHPDRPGGPVTDLGQRKPDPAEQDRGDRKRERLEPRLEPGPVRDWPV